MIPNGILFMCGEMIHSPPYCPLNVLIYLKPNNLFPSEPIPPPPKPISRQRTEDNNKKQIARLVRLAGDARLRQRVVLVGDSWFERLVREGKNNGVRSFEGHISTCADRVDVLAVGGDKGPNSIGKNFTILSRKSSQKCVGKIH